MLCRSTKAVELEDRNDIDLPRSRVSHQSVERRPPVFAAAVAFVFVFDDVEPSAFGILPQWARLRVGGLSVIFGADSHVQPTDSPSARCRGGWKFGLV